jgi:hypothetical protein
MRRLVVSAFLAALLCSGPAAAEPVDLELVLAVDVSMSMDPEEQRVQREGYADAIEAPEVLRAIANGMHGRSRSPMSNGRAPPSSTCVFPGR